jgi:DNA polymerase-1
MKALIDADIVAYRVACTCAEDDAQDFVFARTEDLVDSILVNTEAEEYRLFLTGKDNFRYTIYPEYKAHRPKEKPFWLEAIREYLKATFNAEVVDGQEADDAMGINQSDDTIICSIDKDLLMIPGRHYNFVKDEFIEVTEFDGLKHFYMQCLQGDRADNIKGIPGIGPKKAEKILQGCETEEQLFNAVRDAYGNDDEFLMNGRVLWIRQHDNEDWKDKFNALIQEQARRTSMEDLKGPISIDEI